MSTVLLLPFALLGLPVWNVTTWVSVGPAWIERARLRLLLGGSPWQATPAASAPPPSTDGDVDVRTTVSYGLGEPELIEEATPAGVRLDATCGGVLATRCEVDYVVEVPPSLAVFVEGTSGDVTVGGLTGPVTVGRSTGDIALFDLAGPLDITTRTG